MFQRMTAIPKKIDSSIFIFGPRQTGKSTFLKEHFSKAIWIDLLKADEFRRYTANPESLRLELLVNQSEVTVVIDEIQKVPSLLDEVHWLIENQKIHFVLCGSSARKLKYGWANLLGGRAINYEFFGLVARELKKDFDLKRILNVGYLPKIYQSTQASRLLDSYVSTYLKEEIAAEGLLRNLPAFNQFLSVAALSDTELVNFSSIGRDCAISSVTTKNYFQILVDTLIGRFVNPFQKRAKRRINQMPKFYFFDVGVVNSLVKRRNIEEGSETFGKAFENWLFHELIAYAQYSEKFYEITFWRLSSGIEVDFILDDMQVAIEAKASKNIHSDHLKGLRNLQKDHPEVKKRIVVCLDTKIKRTEDGIDILPYKVFIDELWNGNVL